MPSPNPEDEPSPVPATPRKASTPKKGNNVKTPVKKPHGIGLTPKSAPAAPGARARSNSKKTEPTLLTDFILGRQTPARLAADKQRRMSLEAVKAELRHEMRQNAVRKIQPPGGVKDRVKAWQKKNAAAMVAGNPDDAATEPTDVAFGAETEEVTEADRIRIKMRKKKPPPKKKVVDKPPEVVEDQENPPDDEPAKPPPKKRVISDDHWMNQKNRRASARKVSPRPKKSSPTPSPIPIPKDFTLRNAANPSVSNKVKEWAAKIEVPETPPSKGHRYSRSMDSKSRHDDTESEWHSDMGETASQVTSGYLTNSAVTARRTVKSMPPADDGIRIKPIRKKKKPLDDDGIRVTPINSTLEDDGIRVRPMDEITAEVNNSQPGSNRTARRRSRTSRNTRSPPERTSTKEPSEPSKQEQPDVVAEDIIEIIEEEPETPKIQICEARMKLMNGEPIGENVDTIEVVEEPESVLETPTRRQGSRNRRKPRPKSQYSEMSAPKDTRAWKTDDEARPGASQLSGSDLSSSVTKSIADLPGDIPFGHSAFSELDLPRNGGPPRTRPKRPKPERNTSFKHVPKVFKKVMEEGKKIIHEMNEPPKQPVANNPPSIENWLNNTVDVDPFIDAGTAAPAPASAIMSEPRAPDPRSVPRPVPRPVEVESVAESKAHSRASQETQKARPVSARPTSSRAEPIDKVEKPTPAVETPRREPAPEVQHEVKQEIKQEVKREVERKRTPPKEKVKSPPSGGLKRSRATRGASSPVKPSRRRPFLGMLKEAFQGESKGTTITTPKAYQSHEERKYDEETDDWEDPESSYRQSSPRSSYSDEDDDRTISDDDRSDPRTPRMSGPRLRPPTNGHHELSTILSEGASSAIDSDTTSYLSYSTVTPSTVLTRDSELSKSRDQAPGLKRRLTRHSDLVSVLSLPNDKNIPETIKSSRSRPSLRRNQGSPDEVTTDDLLQEFADDEELYLRELKTLVDGVIPVLLSQVVNPNQATELFGHSGPTCKATAISRSVVNMGVALEKLRNAHRIAPVSDLRRISTWAHGLVPIYNKYLDAWRLGFQDLVVNLAPAEGRPEEEDSLLNAMPRNEEGDIVNSEGERVDVAHLLKRPLLRVKQLAKFIQCIDSIFQTDDTYNLLQDFGGLQDKARRRYREESARLIDEDAINTDTTRARDLRTLALLESVVIDPSLQVSAKDFFSLDLEHSSGQRLECQVELIHRDNERHPDDKGDLLIRETGDGRRTYLLLPPIPMELISARTGEDNLDMVVMIRGTHNDRPWHELLTLTSDNEDQILDWLDILPVAPVPPREPEPSVVGDDEPPPRIDVPVGARGLRKYHSRSPSVEVPSPTSPTTPIKRALPTRYRPQRPAFPSTPPPASSPGSDLEKTPTQDDYRAYDDQYQPDEDIQPEPASFEDSHGPHFRDDGPPPPPIHRIFTPSPSPSPQSPSKSKSIQPPVELQPNPRLKRRQSSPLKHEYLPSEGSTISGTSLTAGTERTITESDYDSEYGSSDDEIESVDVPETEVGYSIREEDAYEEMPAAARPMDSVLSASTCSLTPSNSASQAGLHGPKTSPEDNAARFIAAISRWSEKGQWKDISAVACSVIVTPGLIEAYPLQNGGGSEGKNDKPMLSLDLTPLVLIRQSTAVDLEIRSSLRPECQLAGSCSGGNFRFRCHNGPDCFNLYKAVHHARLNNQKFIQLENEARFKSFGERRPPADNDDSSSNRRSWFGRKNSYRGSVRAPSQSHDGASTTPSSSLSASSFLKRLTGSGNLPFNLAHSSVDRQSRAGSFGNSQYSSSNGVPTPRSPSISVENSARSMSNFGTDNLKIRLHLLVSAAKWEDFGNCRLQIRRPPPGWHQALRANHGLEKRVTVTTIPKKDSEKPKTLLDAVLGSGCFTPMGSRGIVCGVWEEVKDGNGVVGVVPATGATGGNVKKWCFQCASVAEASWVLRLVHQEVLRA